MGISGSYTCQYYSNQFPADIVGGTYNKPMGCITFNPATVVCDNRLDSSGPIRLYRIAPIEGSVCQKNFFTRVHPVEDKGDTEAKYLCQKDNCVEPTSTPSQTQPNISDDPTEITIDPMTSSSSSATSHVGIIGSLVKRGKSVLNWFNSVGTGGIPKDKESLENDLTYDRQTQAVKSKINSSEWDRLVNESIAGYKSGQGYTKPLDLFHGL